MRTFGSSSWWTRWSTHSLRPVIMFSKRKRDAATSIFRRPPRVRPCATLFPRVRARWKNVRRRFGAMGAVGHQRRTRRGSCAPVAQAHPGASPMNGPVLRDIHLPPAHWWPLAPGWWLVAALLALAAFGVAWWLRRAARTLPLRAAMREIDALEAAYARDGDAGQLVDGASRLMRRVALRVAPGAAAQTGATWCAFVHTHAADAGTRQVLDQLASERFRAQP